MFRLDEKIYIRTIQRPGVVKDINQEEKKYKVTYFVPNAENPKEDTRKIDWFDFKDVVSYHKPLEIKIKYFNDDIPKLDKISIGDWIDLRAAENVELKQFEFKLIPLGVAMELPKGYEANITPRGSTFKNFGIIQTNHYGVVDNSYCGNNDQWFIPALAMRDSVINKGDRICQFRVNRVMPKVIFNEVEVLENKDRGGHGTTGTK